jgi:hypothetical protein
MNDEERIRSRAYALWEQEGRPDGKHHEHWERAAAELMAEVAPERSAKGKGRSTKKTASVAASDAIYGIAGTGVDGAITRSSSNKPATAKPTKTKTSKSDSEPVATKRPAVKRSGSKSATPDNPASG